MFFNRKFSWLGLALVVLIIPISAYGVSKEAQKHYDEAMRLSTKELANAIDEMRLAVKLEPKWADAHYHLGTFYQQKQLFDEAMSEYKKVAQLNPKYPKLHYILGAFYYTRGVMAWSRAAKIDKSYFYKDDGKQVFYKPGTPPEKAINQYKKIADKDTLNAPALYNLRGVYYDLAILEYQQAVKTNPNDTSAQYELGLVYLERNKVDRATQQVKALEKLSEGHASGLQQQINMEEAQRKMMKGKK